MQIFTKDHWAHLVLTTVIAAVTVACGGSSDNLGELHAEAATRNQLRQTPRDQVEEGGTFTWPLTSLPPNYNYHQIDGTERDGHDILGALMPSAYGSDVTGTPVWNRDLLASEPVMVTEPKQVVTYRINPKAVWYDGTPITWEDFYWDWKSGNGSNKAYQVASTSGAEDIENVERGADDREVIVTYKHPYADWQANFYMFYPASTNKDPKIFNEGWRDKPLTSAGPFKLGSIDITSKTVTLVRNEKWWGDRAKLDRIVYRAVEGDAQIDALANGEVDAIDVGPDVNKFLRAKDIEGTEMRIGGGPNFRHLTLNGTSENLKDVRVRRALAMAISRPAIARALLAPLGVVAEPLDNHIYMANQAGYRRNAGEVGTYAPEKARALLDEAGWRLEGDVRKKDGKPLTLTAVIPSGIATSRQETELIQNMLAQVGVKLTIDVVPTADFFSKYVTPGQFDFTVFSWMGTAYPVSSGRSLYEQPVRNAAGELDVRQNYARIGTPEIDHLFAQSTQELDPRKAVALANQLDALLWQEVHSLALYQRPEIITCKRRLVNFGAFGFASNWTYQDIGWAK